jgi:hypothetical protein
MRQPALLSHSPRGHLQGVDAAAQNGHLLGERKGEAGGAEGPDDGKGVDIRHVVEDADLISWGRRAGLGGMLGGGRGSWG